MFFLLLQESLEEKVEEVQKKLDELEKNAPEKTDIKVSTRGRIGVIGSRLCAVLWTCSNLDRLRKKKNHKRWC